jgi:hypothetical protein
MVNIYTVSYIKPFFIKIQKELLDKYCNDTYTLNVINNGIDYDTKIKIKNVCDSLKINCIEYNRPEFIEDYCSQSHCVALEHTLINYIKKDSADNITVIIDTDVFPFKNFSFIQLLNNKKIAGIYQQRDYDNIVSEYFTSIFIMFSNDIDISNFSFFNGIGDTGSGTFNLIKTYPAEYIKHTAAIDIETDYIFKNNKNKYPYLPKYRCQFIDDCFIHYYRGSNWSESCKYYHMSKLKFVINFIRNSYDYNINLNEFVSYSKAHADKGYNGVDYNYRDYKFNLVI